jgi:hypothetical protein
MSGQFFAVMRGNIRRSFCIEACVSVCSLLLFIVTLAWPNWIELISGIDPDHGDGGCEQWIVAASALTAMTAFVLARIEWRRSRAARIIGDAT